MPAVVFTLAWCFHMCLAGLIWDNLITLKAHAIPHKNILPKYIVITDWKNLNCTEPHWADSEEKKAVIKDRPIMEEHKSIKWYCFHEHFLMLNCWNALQQWETLRNKTPYPDLNFGFHVCLVPACLSGMASGLRSGFLSGRASIAGFKHWAANVSPPCFLTSVYNGLKNSRAFIGRQWDVLFYQPFPMLTINDSIFTHTMVNYSNIVCHHVLIYSWSEATVYR